MRRAGRSAIARATRRDRSPQPRSAAEPRAAPASPSRDVEADRGLRLSIARCGRDARRGARRERARRAGRACSARWSSWRATRPIAVLASSAVADSIGCAASCWSNAAVPALARPRRAGAVRRDRAARRAQERVAGKQNELERAEQAFAAARDRLRPVGARNAGHAPRAVAGRSRRRRANRRLGREAKDVDDLIKRAEAADRPPRQGVVARARAALPQGGGRAWRRRDTADPTRPAALAAFDAAANPAGCWPPVSGPISPPACGVRRCGGRGRHTGGWT